MDAETDLVGDMIDSEQAEVGSLFSIQGAEFDNVKWSIHRYKTRQEMASDPSGVNKEWVADVTGELRGAELVEQIGGGTFQFLGYVPRSDGRGVRLRFNKTVGLSGPRRNFSAPTTEVVAAASAVQTGPDPTTARLLKAMLRRQREADERFERVISAIAQRPTNGNPTSLVEMVTAMEAMQRMSAAREVKSENSVDVAKMILDGFRDGVQIGQEREPIPVRGEGDGPDYGPYIAKGMEILERILSRRPVPRPGPPPGAQAVPPGGFHPGAPQPQYQPPPPPAASEATVIEDPPTMEHRFATATEALYRAMVNGRDPADFANSLEDMLSPEEVGMISGASADDVLRFLGPYAAQFEALGKPQGKVYLASVLAALRDADDDDATEDESTEKDDTKS